MQVEAQIHIDSNRDAVWAAIANIQGLRDIIKGIVAIEILHQPAEGLTGTQWKETRMYFGKPTTVEKRITNAKELMYYTTTAAMDGFVFTTTFSITEHSNGNITLTSTHATTAQHLMAKLKMLPMIFFKGMLRKAIMQDLSDIKVAVEHGVDK